MVKKVGRKPPLHAAHSVKNSRTSPRIIARRKRMLEALSYREVGNSYTEIAHQMRVSRSVVHTWVVELLRELPIENAKEVRRLELARLDQMLAAHYPAAAQGDVSATQAVLQIMRQRAQLLGLYPEHGGKVEIAVVAHRREWSNCYRACAARGLA
jgi:hypothetical protein